MYFHSVFVISFFRVVSLYVLSSLFVRVVLSFFIVCVACFLYDIRPLVISVGRSSSASYFFRYIFHAFVSSLFMDVVSSLFLYFARSSGI